MQFKPPEAFNYQSPVEWLRWKKQFPQFQEASGLSEENNSKQISMLLNCMGEEADNILSSTDVSEDDRTKYDSMMDAFFKVRRNIICERGRFNRCNQIVGEQYITQLYQLAENCEYPSKIREKMIRDRLAVGIKDAALSAALQLDTDLTLEKAKKKICQKEAIKEQQQIVNTEDTTIKEIR